MFEMSLPSSKAANLQLPLFQGLLVAAQQRLIGKGSHIQQEQTSGSQQRVQQLTVAEPPMVPVRDAATWQVWHCAWCPQPVCNRLLTQQHEVQTVGSFILQHCI